ncbi:MAG: MBL fold metallo-hydrolase [Micavibrio aeruginosavorus]|uniref:MBL fold metallo-hydrolase n=1 Tax=Micavibrio aeruginosavorus TaxID=349221 RepID=A0A7T5R1J8_9BACT|nr:MAG: MBL fold metallo-hydrolase [Micavibrio aeruginosavorus]
MFLETVRSEGLNHFSYVVGDNGKAAVIDPRRDCKVYVEIAKRHGAQITYIFETHRHEDFVVGSLELARRTKARILHGKTLAFKYGEGVKDGDTFNLGDITLKVLETPGHTPESISLALIDNAAGDKAVGVFTGDALLVGDVGRTDFYPDRKEELAEKLYEILHRKLLPLGDQAIIYPAHGEGSVCGGSLAAREFSTVGYERQFNPMLAKNRKDFIQHKIWEEHHTAPYFRQMEKFNQDGIPLVAKLLEPEPASADDFSAAVENDGLFVLDVRSPGAFAGSHIQGALSIPLDRLALMAGWFLPYDRKIGLVADRDSDAAEARLYMMRMGYDNAALYLAGGMNSWAEAGKSIESIPAVDVETLRRRVANKEDFLVLDVRNRTEYVQTPSDPSVHIWIGDLPQRIKDLSRNRRIITLCNSGRRAIIAASLLKQAKFGDVEVCLGSAKTYKTLQIPGKTSKRVAA